jgi:hypothetical protein
MHSRLQHTSLYTIMALVGFVSAALGQSGNSQVGVWRANIAKSTFAAGPAVKSTTTTFEVAGEGAKGTVDAEYTDGTKVHWVTTTKYDGKETPIVGNSPYGDAAAMTRVDANTVRTVYKKGVKVTTTQTSVVSADGKTRTVTSKGTNAQGQTIDSVLFYDKQ